MREFEQTEKVQSMLPYISRRDLYGRYCKKIDAFLTINNLPLSKEKEYFKKYTEEEFDELIRKFYIIKGKEITHLSILKAKKKTEKTEDTEHEIQVKVCKYLDSKNLKYWAIPNGFVRGGDNKLENAKYINYMRSEGYKNGIFDLTILMGNGKIAFLELKTLKGKPSEYQLKWQEYFVNNNYLSAICYGYDEAISFIDNLL